jgi:hypothetical protein
LCFKSVHSQILFLVFITNFFYCFLDSIYITNVSELYHSRYTLYNEPTPEDQYLTRGSIKLTSQDQSLIERSIKIQTYVTRLYFNINFEIAVNDSGSQRVPT